MSPVFLVIAIEHNFGPIGDGEVNSDLIALVVGLAQMERVMNITLNRGARS